MVNTQMIPYLSKIGYSLMQRGYILAGSAIVAIAGQFIFGYICDRYKKIRPFFLIAYILLTISSFAMFLVEKDWFFYHLFSVSFMGGLVKVIMGLDETWMLEVDEDNYGKLRASGAIGLTIGSPIAGILIHQFSYQILVFVFGGIAFLLLFLISKSKDAIKGEKETIHFSNIQQLIKNSSYCTLVLIFLFVYMIGTADQYVVIDKMLSIGAGNGEVGIKWAVQSFMEVPLFLFASKILKKWKPETLLLLGTLMYSVKFFLYGFLWEPWMLIATASLQLVTLPIIMLSSKVLIKEVTPKSLCSSAQMFAMAIFIGVSGLFTPLITSFLSKQYGYNSTLYMVAGFAIVPFLIILYYRKHKKKELRS